MTTAKLYRKFKNGEVSREKFLYEVRRDSNLPWITNTTSFDDAVKILKHKSIISELDANIKADPAVDRVNPYFLKAGVQNMLSKEDELDNESYMKALNKAAKMLQKNPHVFDDLMLKNADEIEKKDAKLHTKEVKKGDLNDVANQMKKVKVKDKTKKAKTLKEAALDELATSLKKKESINEDTHWKHTVGSEIHTPDGPGKIKEIMGSTFTVEMQDGTLKDYQINVIEKAIEKQKEIEANPQPAIEPKKPEEPKQEPSKPFRPNVDLGSAFEKLKKMMEVKKEDKPFLTKMKDKIKKLKETRALVVPKSATGAQIDQIAQKDPNIKPGQQVDIIRK